MVTGIIVAAALISAAIILKGGIHVSIKVEQQSTKSETQFVNQEEVEQAIHEADKENSNRVYDGLVENINKYLGITDEEAR